MSSGPRTWSFLTFLAYASTLIFVRAQACTPADDPVWDTLQPSTPDSINWESCYSGNFCTRLTVPLDYANPSVGNARIALIKIPAAVSANNTSYRGPILFNPGGPGVPGVAYVVANGKHMQDVFGSEYDIIGFDPRGVAHTQPAANFWLSEGEDFVYQLGVTSDGAPNATSDAVGRLIGRSHVISTLAEARGKDFAPYMTTALVARDMLTIVNALGQEKLQYWGISYGSLVGMTFASMFPDKIERMIVDGVVDTDDYFSATVANLERTDAGLRLFFEACTSVGPEKCALYEDTADKVQARYQRILDSLKTTPLVVLPEDPTDPLASYGLISYKDAHAFTWGFMYSPYFGTPNSTEFAAAFRAAEVGDGSVMWSFIGGSTESIDCGGNCTQFPIPPILAADDAQKTILCTDVDPFDETVPELQKYFTEQLQISQFADIWIVRSFCEGWKVKPVERFRGPFAGNTSFPLLFIGNTNDVVLPVQNAIKQSRGFPGSVVLTQNSAGHCTIAAVSQCIGSAMRAYMRDGTLPQNGTVCEIESQYFEQKAPAATKRSEGGVAEAWRDLVSSAPVPRFMV